MGVIYIDLKFKIVQVLIKGTRISDCMNISFPDNTGVGSAVFFCLGNGYSAVYANSCPSHNLTCWGTTEHH